MVKTIISLLRSFYVNLKIGSTIIRVKNRFPGVIIERNVVIKGDPDNLKLGKNVVIQSGSVLHVGGMDWCHNTGAVEIGDNGIISPNCVIYGCGEGGVHIGKNFDCAPGVGIFSSCTDYKHGPNCHIFLPVHIGDNVTIFANAVISPGVNIGENAVVAACSVVTRDVPPNTFVGGSPARVIRENIRPQ